MREILFKAKRIYDGKWVEGYYTECRGKTFVGIDISIGIDMFEVFCTPVIGWFEVDPETLCEFTGRCDKYGNKIWENDIVKTVSDIYAQVKFGLYTTGFVLKECNQGFYVDFSDETYLRHELGYWNNKVEVRGNIFDNPELLQEETDE